MFPALNSINANTPEAVKRQRAIAEALQAQSLTPANNWATGLGDVAAAISGTVLSGRADEAERLGQESVAAALAGLGPNSSFEDVSAALSNPWLANSPGGSAVAEALLSQNLQRNDPMYQMQLEQAQLELDALRNPAPQLYDPNAPSSWQEYQLGLANPDYAAQMAADNGSLVTVNTGDNSGAFTKKGDELAATRLDAIITDGQGAQRMMGDINALAALGSQMNTGKAAEFMAAIGPYAEAVGVDISGLGEAQAYKAIVDRMAPQMRPAGSGAASDFDAKQFLNSLPQLGNSPEGNQIITETLSALQQHKIAAAEIASQAFSGQMTWQEAEAQIRALGDPYESFNNYRKRSGVSPSNGIVTAPGGITIRRLD